MPAVPPPSSRSMAGSPTTIRVMAAIKSPWATTSRLKET
jgi:hypothetical protein